MEKIFYLIIFLYLIFTNCYDVKIIPFLTPKTFPPKRAKEIIILKYESTANRYMGIIKNKNNNKWNVYLEGDYKVVAEIRVMGLSSTKGVEKKMRAEAAKIGGDAIIIPMPEHKTLFEMDKTPKRIYGDGQGNYTIYEEQPINGIISSETGYVIRWKD